MQKLKKLKKQEWYVDIKVDFRARGLLETKRDITGDKEQHYVMIK